MQTNDQSFGQTDRQTDRDSQTCIRRNTDGMLKEEPERKKTGIDAHFHTDDDTLANLIE